MIKNPHEEIKHFGECVYFHEEERANMILKLRVKARFRDDLEHY
jgi:hypothetical protein